MSWRIARGVLLGVFATILLYAGPMHAQKRDKTYDRGMSAKELDPSSRGPVSGVGIESQDIIGMTDRMVRDMLSNPQLAARSVAPRVIVDDQYFTNESSQR